MPAYWLYPLKLVIGSRGLLFNGIPLIGNLGLLEYPPEDGGRSRCIEGVNVWVCRMYVLILFIL